MEQVIEFERVVEEEDSFAVVEQELEPLDPEDPRFQPAVWRTDRELAIVAPTHIMSPKMPWEAVERHYRQNPIKTLRDYLCVSSTSTEPFFRDPDILDIRVNRERHHPFKQNEILSSRGRDNFLTRWLRDDFRPTPGKVYFAHVDTSKNRDATGVAVAHWDKAIQREIPDVGTALGQIVVDLMVRISAPPNEDIHYEGVRALFTLLKRRGFAIRIISFDQFQSLHMTQLLQKQGFATDTLSMDRKTDAYDTLQEMLVLGKLDYYDYEPFREECKYLLLKPNGKVDHPAVVKGKPGRKDVADAVAGAVYWARAFAGEEVYAMSVTMDAREAMKSVTQEDDRYREELLGFRDVSTIW